MAFGWPIATLLHFIDADDEWKPQHLGNLLKAREVYPHCGVYATNFSWVMPDGSMKHPAFPGLQADTGFCLVRNYFAVSTTTSILSCSSVAMTKSVLGELGGFPATEFVKEDHVVWATIALNYEVGFCMEPTMIYHLDSENRADARVRRIKSQLKDCDTLLLKTLNDALARRDYRNRSVTREDIKTYRRKVLFWRASDLIKIGRSGRGRIAAVRAMAVPGYFLRSIKLIGKSIRPD